MVRIILIIALSTFGGLHMAQAQSKSYPFSYKTLGQGPDLILIPGLASSSDVWNEAVDSLGQHFTCHLLTLAGFAGENPIKVEDGFLPKVRTALVAYIQKEADGKAILMGHSLGGFLSMDIASEQPGLVEKLIIVDSYPFYSASMNPTATEESAKAPAERFKKTLLSTSDSMFSEQQRMTMPMLATPGEKAKLAWKWSLESDRATIAQAMYEIMTTDLREEVGKITCPVLVFGSWYAGKNYGITKEMVRSQYEAQFSKTPEVDIKMAETARHFVMWDEPQWFLAEVLKFIK